MLDRTIRNLGYIKESDITEDYLLEQYVKKLGNPAEYELPKELEEEFFDMLRRNDVARDYLRATTGKDVLRYFAAQTEAERNVIRGGFSRTIYLLSKLRKQKLAKE